MASSTFLLFLALNILLVTFISACGECPSTPLPKPKPKPTPKPAPKPPATPTPKPPTTPTPKPPPTQPKCPKDVLKLGVCGDVLGVVNIIVGSSSAECCSLLSGLADLDAAVCLCTALKANILGINLNIPISLTVLLNVCDRKMPKNFSCA